MIFIILSAFSVIIVAACWLLLAYIAYALLFSSLACYPLSSRPWPAQKSPFDGVRYHGGDAPGPDRIALLESPVDGLGLRLEMFDHVEHSLDVVCHTIHTGPSTSAFFDGIVRAAERGVTVRILLDGKASMVRPEVLAMLRALAALPGIECRLYNPIHPLKPWKWHFLMHDKYIVGDGRYLLLGGRNMGDKFFAPSAYKGSFSNDRDVFVLQACDDAVVESGVTQAQRYFEAMWRGNDTRPLRPARRGIEDARAALQAQAGQFAQENPAYYEKTFAEYLQATQPTRKITFVHNPTQARRKTPWIWEQMQRMAMEADHSVLLQTPYITANRDILTAFRRVAGKVPLSILTNSVASTPNYPAYSNYYAKRHRFIQTGASIYEYQNVHSIHGKAMVVDERLGVLGSFNMDDRSMFLDTEVMLIVDSEPFAAGLVDAIGAYQAQSLRVNAQNGYTVPEDFTAVSVSAYKVPLLRFCAMFSLPFRALI